MSEEVSRAGNGSAGASSLLIQVLPRMTPGRCGLSDHALALAGALRSEFGIDSAFVAVNSQVREDLPYEVVYCLPSRLPESCVELGKNRSAAVLAHVSGYGYSSDGAPTLLAEALERLKATGWSRIGAYFHETYAGGFPPWKAAFWYTGKQQRALRKIVAQCELIITNTENHARWLGPQSRQLGGPAVDLLPVISTVGEAEVPAPFGRRAPALVVFGLAATRAWAYGKLRAANGLAGLLGIQEILDVGPECNHPAAVNGVPVKRVGLLPMEQLSKVLSQAQFGFTPHPWNHLSKSSIFAAYCALGTVAVVAKPFSGEVDGLRDGVQVVSPRSAEAACKAGWENCSRAAWNWYAGHRVRVHAKRYAAWISQDR